MPGTAAMPAVATQQSTVARIEDIQLVTPPGWAVERPGPAAGSVAPGTVATRAFFVAVAADADRSQPYFLRRPRTGAGAPPCFETTPRRPFEGLSGTKVTHEVLPRR